MNITETGIWETSDKKEHGFDEPLADAIYKLIRSRGLTEVKDFGCGSGAYVDYFVNHGLWSVGYDGNPHVGTFSTHCFTQDISKPVDLGTTECVVSLEVGEHIPKKFEKDFMDNITRHAEKLLILSWFPYKGEGIGHINERPNWEIQAEMMDRGFRFLPIETSALRTASTLWWFARSVMAFEKNEQVA